MATDRPSHLRVAAADEKPAKPKKPKSITDSLCGTSRDVLDAMRTALAKQLDNGQIAGNSIASAYRELRELDRLIRVADAEVKAEETKRNAANGTRRSFDSTAI